MWDVCCRQKWMKAPLYVLQTGVLARTMWKYRYDHGLRFVLADAGHTSAALYSAAASFGLGAYTTYTLQHTRAERQLNLDPAQETLLTVTAVGYSKAKVNSIYLAPMTAQELSLILPQNLINHAKNKVEAGQWPEFEAHQRALEAYRGYLSQKGTRQRFFSLKVRDLSVGWIWLGIPEAKNSPAFLYMVEIFPKYRGKGYGREAMKALEEKIKKMGRSKIGLHVFQSNNIAVKLYKSLGYTTMQTKQNSLLLRKII